MIRMWRMVNWLCALVAISGVGIGVAWGQDAPCTARPLDSFAPAPASGVLMLDNVRIFDEADAAAMREQIGDHPTVQMVEQTIQHPQISPNGRFIAATFPLPRPSDADDTRTYETVVLNIRSEIIYQGAWALLDEGNEEYILGHWLENDRLIVFLRQQINHNFNSQLYSEFRIGYYLISPFEHEYVFVEAPIPSWFYYSYGRDTKHPSQVVFTYDGRYGSTLGTSPYYDFVTQQPIDRPQSAFGVYSTTSHRMIIVEDDQAQVSSDAEHQSAIIIYDVETDERNPTMTLNTPNVIITHPNSWSPDEAQWAYTLRSGDARAIDLKRIFLLHFNLGQMQPTCMGLYYTTDYRTEVNEHLTPVPDSQYLYINYIYPPDFAWSLDSRYLALQGVIEGENMEESLGVYIYDTETGDIYEAYRGRADVIGWMSAE